MQLRKEWYISKCSLHEDSCAFQVDMDSWEQSEKTGQEIETIILFSLQFLWNVQINWIRFVMGTVAQVYVCSTWFSTRCTVHCVIKHWITVLCVLFLPISIRTESVNDGWTFNELLDSNISIDYKSKGMIDFQMITFLLRFFFFFYQFQHSYTRLVYFTPIWLDNCYHSSFRLHIMCDTKIQRPHIRNILWTIPSPTTSNEQNVWCP